MSLRYWTVPIALGVILASLSGPCHAKEKAAVLEFDEKNDIGVDGAGAIIAEWLIGAINETGKYEIVERPLLRKVLEEKGFQLTDVVDPETATRFSTVYGVRYIITGSVMKWGERISITSRLISVDTAEIIRDEKVWAGNLNEVPDKVEQMGKLLTLSRQEKNKFLQELAETQRRRELLRAAMIRAAELKDRGSLEQALEVLSDAERLANTDEDKQIVRTQISALNQIISQVQQPSKVTVTVVNGMYATIQELNCILDDEMLFSGAGIEKDDKIKWVTQEIRPGKHSFLVHFWYVELKVLGDEKRYYRRGNDYTPIELDVPAGGELLITATCSVEDIGGFWAGSTRGKIDYDLRARGGTTVKVASEERQTGSVVIRYMATGNKFATVLAPTAKVWIDGEYVGLSNKGPYVGDWFEFLRKDLPPGSHTLKIEVGFISSRTGEWVSHGSGPSQQPRDPWHFTIEVGKTTTLKIKHYDKYFGGINYECEVES